MHETVEPGRIDALQRTRYLQVKRMAPISLDEREKPGKNRERAQPERHRATSPGERPAWGEHLAHGETTGRRLGEDSWWMNSGFRVLRVRQSGLPVGTKDTSVPRPAVCVWQAKRVMTSVAGVRADAAISP